MKKNTMKKNSFIEGTIFAYIAIILTKIIGAVYVIPFHRIVGDSGWILNTYAYNVYNLFLNVSTSGIPTAVAIIIAEYNALKMFNEREYAYKIATKVISIISIIAFLIMFIFAKQIALFFISDIEVGSSIENIVMVIRVVSFCLLIVPFLSITRGYLQGNKYTAVSSISQFIEQVVRIVIVLVGSYVVVNILNYSIALGTAVALSGTVIGAIAAYLFLRYKIHKNKEEFTKDLSSDEIKVTKKEVIKKIIFYAVPVVVVALTQNIYEIIDFKFILKGLTMIGISGVKAENLATIITASTPKICMIINALALGLIASVIPFIVSEYVKKNNKNMNALFNQAISTIFYVGLPLSLFLVIFSSETYYIFFGKSIEGSIILKMNAIVSIFFSASLVINTILQGMKKYKTVYINSVVGIVINALLDIPIIMLFDKLGFYPYLGTLTSTIVGLIISISIVMITLKKELDFKYKEILTCFLKIILYLLPSIIIMIILEKYIFISNSYFMTLILLAVSSLITIGLYILITYKTGLMNEIFKDDIIKKIMGRIRKK